MGCLLISRINISRGYRLSKIISLDRRHVSMKSLKEGSGCFRFFALSKRKKKWSVQWDETRGDRLDCRKWSYKSETPAKRRSRSMRWVWWYQQWHTRALTAFLTSSHWHDGSSPNVISSAQSIRNLSTLNWFPHLTAFDWELLRAFFVPNSSSGNRTGFEEEKIFFLWSILYKK